MFFILIIFKMIKNYWIKMEENVLISFFFGFYGSDLKLIGCIKIYSWEEYCVVCWVIF